MKEWLLWDKKWTPEGAKANWENDCERKSMEYMGSIIRELKVVDLGCGGALLSKFCTNYTGVDSAQVNLNYAKNHARVVRAELGDLPFKHKSFDIAVLRHVLEHNPPIYAENILQEASRIAKRTIVCFYYPPSDGCEIGYDDGGFYQIAHDKKMLKNYNLSFLANISKDEIWITPPQ